MAFPPESNYRSFFGQGLAIAFFINLLQNFLSLLGIEFACFLLLDLYEILLLNQEGGLS
jgi:hypothetical protein